MTSTNRVRPTAARWPRLLIVLAGGALSACEIGSATIGTPPPGGGDNTPDAGDVHPPGEPDAAVVAPGTPDAAPDPAPLTECTDGPSIDRIKSWYASGEGTTVPATGTMVVADGARYTARIQFVGAEWHVAVVWVKNQFDAQADFSGAAGFSITYAATDDLYIQLRPASHWDGGDKYVVKLPSTGGARTTTRVSFDPKAWTTLPELGVPTYPFTDAIKEVRGLVFVGKTPNTIELRGLRVDGYTPPCQ